MTRRDVDEAVRDTFERVWRSLERPATTPHLQLAVPDRPNEALTRRRKTLPTSELHATTVSDGENAFAAAHVRAFLIERLRMLPVEYRAAVVLRDIHALSNEEVARALDVSLAAKSRIQRGRMQLGEKLECWESGEGSD